MIPIRCTVHPQDPWDNWYGGHLVEVTPPTEHPMGLVVEDSWTAQSNNRAQIRWVPLAWVRARDLSVKEEAA